MFFFDISTGYSGIEDYVMDAKEIWLTDGRTTILSPSSHCGSMCPNKIVTVAADVPSAAEIGRVK